MTMQVDDMLGQIFGPPQRPDPEAMAAIRKFASFEQGEMLRMRRQLWFWAAVVCSCTRWGNWREDHAPPQLHCPLHGHRQLGPDGVLR